MFDKVMAAVGIGNAHVDTRLEKSTVKAGDTLRGAIHIQGGQVSQDLSGLVLDMTSEVIKEVDDKKVRVPHTWATLRISEPMTIQAAEQKEIGFEIDMPLLSPLSIG